MTIYDLNWSEVKFLCLLRFQPNNHIGHLHPSNQQKPADHLFGISRGFSGCSRFCLSVQPAMLGQHGFNGFNHRFILAVNAAVTADGDRTDLECRRGHRLIDQLKRKELDFRINGSHNRIPGSLSLSFKSTDGEMLLHRLDLMGTAVATGSACNSKDTVLSHVIQAISVPQEYAHGTIRVTLGMDNTVEQVDRIAQQIASILR